MRLYKYVLILLGLSVFCQQSPMAETNKPEKVYRAIYQMKDADWYEKQAALWKKEVENDRQNAEAWYNYFLASRYSLWKGDTDTYKSKTEAILKEMGAYIPESYEYNYLQYYNGNRDLSLLEKAYRIDPKRPDALYEFILHYEKNGQKEKLKKFCRELYQTEDIAPGLLNYNYNMLASTGPNALLFTNGDNDSYPGWVLQETFGIRPDVAVLNLHLCFVDREYLKQKLMEKGINVDVTSYPLDKMSTFLAALADDLYKKYPQIPVYTAVTVYQQFVSTIEDKLYLVGLAFKYSPERFDNWQIINKNIHNNLRLDYLDFNWYNETYLVNDILDDLNINYTVLFLKMAEGLKENGNTAEAVVWKDKALHLAEKAGNEEFIEHIHELNW